MNYYRRYSGDYLRDTARLNLTEHGAYTLLMDYYYTDEKPLPLDLDELCLMVRAMRSEDRAAVEKVLSIYFQKRVDGYHQKRIDHEIEVSKSARENGKSGGRPKTKHQTGQITGNETRTGTEGNAGEVTGTPTESTAGKGGGSGHPPTSNLQPPTSIHHPPSSSAATAAVAKPGASPCPHLEILALYSKHLPMGRQPDPKLWNGTRAKHLATRWKEDPKRQSLDWWDRFFAHCAKSDFLTGRTPPRQGREPFLVSLDWIVEPGNFVKVYEGAYNRERG